MKLAKHFSEQEGDIFYNLTKNESITLILFEKYLKIFLKV